MSSPKVPRHPPDLLRFDDEDIVEFVDVAWRIHATMGAHVLGWSQLRRYGPVTSCRWDPHPHPPGEHPGHGVLYAATDLETAAAEVFQQSRVIDTTARGMQATAWRPTRALRLLDLTRTWAVKNRAAAALSSSPRSTCRRWAREISTGAPHLDGLWTRSTMTGNAVIVMFGPAADSFPDHPAFSEPLATPGLWSVMDDIAQNLGYGIR